MKLTKEEWHWILYDVGNSAFVLLVSTIIPIYFETLTTNAGLSNTQYLAYWGYAASAVTIIVAMIGPIVGAFSDRKNVKKKVLLTTILIGAFGCLLLTQAVHYISFLLIFIFAKIGYSLSLIVYDSMLSDITTDTRLDIVSSSGYAFGYIGSCIPFVLSLVLILFGENWGISALLSIQLAFGINAFWWILLSIPLLRSYKQKHYIENETVSLRSGSIYELFTTLKSLRDKPKVLFFLIAFFFYIDGVYTIIDMATAYGTAVGLDSTMLLLALLVTQIVAFPFALLFGRLSKKYKTENLIILCILAYLGIALFAIFMDTPIEFWILAICVGMFQGGIQALSRSYFTKIIPTEESGRYFGILDICGKGASFVGTLLVGVFTQLTNSSSGGVSVISFLIVIGLLFFLKSLRYSDNKTI